MWHDRLGHVSQSILNKISIMSNVLAINSGMNNVYIPFALAKYHKILFTNKHISCNSPLELLYFYICENASIQGLMVKSIYY